MELETLIDIGLSPEEGRVYLSLLNTGSSSATVLSKNSGIKRTYVYAICKSLSSKGLLVIHESRGKTVFTPQSPDYLLRLSESKRAKAVEAQARLEGVMEQLKNQFKSIDARPIVQVFEGVEGVKKIYLDTLREGVEISAVVETSEIDPELRSWLKDYYTLERARLGIHAKVILASGKLSGEYQSRNDSRLRTVREIPSSKYPIKHEVDIYGDKVAFIKYHKDEPIVGLLIDNALVAQTMRAWFELSWKGAESETR
jgi:sugar-specific transcriptional regulator TrmB